MTIDEKVELIKTNLFVLSDLDDEFHEYACRYIEKRRDIVDNTKALLEDIRQTNANS